MERIKVLLIDKREVFRRGLAKLLESEANIEVVSTCSSMLEVSEKAGGLELDVVLMDIEGLGSKHIETIQHICKLWPKARIMILTHSEDRYDVVLSCRAGVSGYISKDIMVEHLIKAITLVAHGEIVISPPMAAELLEEFTSLEAIEAEAEVKDNAGLSQRERQVLTLVAKGATNREIATTLFIAENTVKVHLSHILEKLHLHNRQQATVWGITKGLVSNVTKKTDTQRV